MKYWVALNSTCCVCLDSKEGFDICTICCDILAHFIVLFQVLEKYPNTPMSHKEILQVIQRERLKEIR